MIIPAGMNKLRDNFYSVDSWLLLVVAIGTGLRVLRLGDFDNQYYTATVASMIQSPLNFLFASFDPGGFVMVDKPPVSFWVQAVPAMIFGTTSWSVTVPQVITGSLAIVVLYATVRTGFGRIAAVSSAVALACIPASIIIDSRNEPDALLSFILVLAAFSIVRAVRTGKLGWLIAFAILMGLGFNTKMLVAFIPLPAFLLYYLVASDIPIHKILKRSSLGVGIIVVVSLFWMSIVALTPPDNRPYVGSTPDNSIWTLAFRYNGLDRFTSFIGPRRIPPMSPGQVIGSGPTGVSMFPGQPPGPPQSRVPILSRQATGSGQTGISMVPSSAIGQGQAAPPLGSMGGQESGLLGLLYNPLSGQLGWLLPLALFSLSLTLIPLLTETVYRRPRTLFSLLRSSPRASQGVLWGGWFTTGVAVFGLASSTTTHPYYLVGVAVPMAAILGIGFSILWRTFRRGGSISWVFPGVLVSCFIYQAWNSHGLIADWAIAFATGVLFFGALIMVVGIYKRTTPKPLSSVAVIVSVLSIFVMPLSLGLTAGGRIGGPDINPARVTRSMPIDRDQDRVQIISSFISNQGDPGKLFAIGTVNARDAAPFIIAGIPAVSIGGFSGSDPVFSTESFRYMVERGELNYFLMPDRNNILRRPDRGSSQEQILRNVSLNWQDVSRLVGLPPRTIYRYRG